MEAKAVKKHIRSSPRKMRLVIDMIRGKKVSEALSILKFSAKTASEAAELTLRSAMSNLINKSDQGNFGADDMIVKEIFVDAGPMLKRISPAPMGRAYRIRKRSNHLTIIVAQASH